MVSMGEPVHVSEDLGAVRADVFAAAANSVFELPPSQRDKLLVEAKRTVCRMVPVSTHSESIFAAYVQYLTRTLAVGPVEASRRGRVFVACCFYALGAATIDASPAKRNGRECTVGKDLVIALSAEHLLAQIAAWKELAPAEGPVRAATAGVPALKSLLHACQCVSAGALGSTQSSDRAHLASFRSPSAAGTCAQLLQRMIRQRMQSDTRNVSIGLPRTLAATGCSSTGDPHLVVQQAITGQAAAKPGERNLPRIPLIHSDAETLRAMQTSFRQHNRVVSRRRRTKDAYTGIDQTTCVLQLELQAPRPSSWRGQLHVKAVPLDAYKTAQHYHYKSPPIKPLVSQPVKPTASRAALDEAQLEPDTPAQHTLPAYNAASESNVGLFRCPDLVLEGCGVSPKKHAAAMDGGRTTEFSSIVLFRDGGRTASVGGGGGRDGIDVGAKVDSIAENEGDKIDRSPDDDEEQPHRAGSISASQVLGVRRAIDQGRSELRKSRDRRRVLDGVLMQADHEADVAYVQSLESAGDAASIPATPGTTTTAATLAADSVDAAAVGRGVMRYTTAVQAAATAAESRTAAADENVAEWCRDTTNAASAAASATLSLRVEVARCVKWVPLRLSGEEQEALREGGCDIEDHDSAAGVEELRGPGGSVHQSQRTLVVTRRGVGEARLAVEGLARAVLELAAAELVAGLLHLEVCEWLGKLDAKRARSQAIDDAVGDTASVSASVAGDGRLGSKSLRARGLGGAWRAAVSARVQSLRVQLPADTGRLAANALRRCRVFSQLAMGLAGPSTRALAVHARASIEGGMATLPATVVGSVSLQSHMGPAQLASIPTKVSSGDFKGSNDIEETNMSASQEARVWLLTPSTAAGWLRQARFSATHAVLVQRRDSQEQPDSSEGASFKGMDDLVHTIAQLAWGESQIPISGHDLRSPQPQDLELLPDTAAGSQPQDKAGKLASLRLLVEDAEAAAACRSLLLGENELSAGECRILLGGRSSRSPLLQLATTSTAPAILLSGDSHLPGHLPIGTARMRFEEEEGPGLALGALDSAEAYAACSASRRVACSAIIDKLMLVDLQPRAAARIRSALRELDWSGDGRVDEPALRDLGLGHGPSGRVGPRLLAWITSRHKYSGGLGGRLAQSSGSGDVSTSQAVGLAVLVRVVQTLALEAPRACLKLLVNGRAMHCRSSSQGMLHQIDQQSATETPQGTIDEEFKNLSTAAANISDSARSATMQCVLTGDDHLLAAVAGIVESGQEALATAWVSADRNSVDRRRIQSEGSEAAKFGQRGSRPRMDSSSSSSRRDRSASRGPEGQARTGRRAHRAQDSASLESGGSAEGGAGMHQRSRLPSAARSSTHSGSSSPGALKSTGPSHRRGSSADSRVEVLGMSSGGSKLTVDSPSQSARSATLQDGWEPDEYEADDSPETVVRRQHLENMFGQVGLSSRRSKAYALKLQRHVARLHWQGQQVAAQMQPGSFGALMFSGPDEDGLQEGFKVPAPALVEHIVVLEASRPAVVLGSCAHPSDVLLQTGQVLSFPSESRHRVGRLEVPDHLERFVFFDPPRLSTSYVQPSSSRFVITQADGKTLFCSSLVIHMAASPSQLVAHAARQMREGEQDPAHSARAQHAHEIRGRAMHFSVPLWLRQALQRAGNDEGQGSGSHGLWQPVALVACSQHRAWDIHRILLAEISLLLAAASTVRQFQPDAATQAGGKRNSGRSRVTEGRRRTMPRDSSSGCSGVAASHLMLQTLCESVTAMPSALAIGQVGVRMRLLSSDMLLVARERDGPAFEPGSHAKRASPGRRTSHDFSGAIAGLLRGPAGFLTDSGLDAAPLSPLVLSLRPTDIILAWLLLVCERKLVVCGTSREHVLSACEALLSLLHPLRWVVSYVPALPPESIHIVNAPNPYLIGWRGTADEILLESSSEPPAVLDLDAQELVIDAEMKRQFRLPQEVMRGLKDALQLEEARERAKRAAVAFASCELSSRLNLAAEPRVLDASTECSGLGLVVKQQAGIKRSIDGGHRVNLHSEASALVALNSLRYIGEARPRETTGLGLGVLLSGRRDREEAKRHHGSRLVLAAAMPRGVNEKISASSSTNDAQTHGESPESAKQSQFAAATKLHPPLEGPKPQVTISVAMPNGSLTALGVDYAHSQEEATELAGAKQRSRESAFNRPVLWQSDQLLHPETEAGIRTVFAEALLALLARPLEHVVIVNVGATATAAEANSTNDEGTIKPDSGTEKTSEAPATVFAQCELLHESLMKSCSTEAEKFLFESLAGSQIFVDVLTEAVRPKCRPTRRLLRAATLALRQSRGKEVGSSDSLRQLVGCGRPDGLLAATKGKGTPDEKQDKRVLQVLQPWFVRLVRRAQECHQAAGRLGPRGRGASLLSLAWLKASTRTSLAGDAGSSPPRRAGAGGNTIGGVAPRDRAFDSPRSSSLNLGSSPGTDASEASLHSGAGATAAPSPKRFGAAPRGMVDVCPIDALPKEVLKAVAGLQQSRERGQDDLQLGRGISADQQAASSGRMKGGGRTTGMGKLGRAGVVFASARAIPGAPGSRGFGGRRGNQSGIKSGQSATRGTIFGPVLEEGRVGGHGSALAAASSPLARSVAAVTPSTTCAVESAGLSEQPGGRSKLHQRQFFLPDDSRETPKSVVAGKSFGKDSCGSMRMLRSASTVGVFGGSFRAVPRGSTAAMQSRGVKAPSLNPGSDGARVETSLQGVTAVDAASEVKNLQHRGSLQTAGQQPDGGVKIHKESSIQQVPELALPEDSSCTPVPVEEPAPASLSDRSSSSSIVEIVSADDIHQSLQVASRFKAPETLLEADTGAGLAVNAGQPGRAAVRHSRGPSLAVQPSFSPEGEQQFDAPHIRIQVDEARSGTAKIGIHSTQPRQAVSSQHVTSHFDEDEAVDCTGSAASEGVLVAPRTTPGSPMTQALQQLEAGFQAQLERDKRGHRQADGSAAASGSSWMQANGGGLGGMAGVEGGARSSCSASSRPHRSQSGGRGYLRRQRSDTQFAVLEARRGTSPEGDES